MAPKLLSPTSPGYIASTQPLINKSQYLASALESLTQGNQEVRGGLGEVAARIGTAYLLNRGQKKTDAKLAGVVAGQRKAKSDAALGSLAGLLGPEGAVAGTLPAASPQSAVGGAVPAIAPQAAPAGLGAALIPQAPAGNQPLSVRNNNPGNLRWDGKSQWQGMKGVDPKGFVQFLTPEAGQRAAGINLANQQKLHGINTLSALISKYAPQSDNNDTAAYIRTVSQKTGLDPNAPLNLQDPAVQAKILPVMFSVESGGTPAQFQPQPQQQAMAQPMPQAPAGPPSPGSPPAGSAALQANPAGGVPQGQFAHAPIDPQEVAFARQLLQSQDPAEQEQGYAMVQDLQKRAMTPVKYDSQSVNGGIALINPYTREASAAQLPGNLQSQVRSAQELGITAPPGTMYSVNASGTPTRVAEPQAGQQVASAPGQPYQEAPISGGTLSPTSPMNRLEGLKSFRAELKPTLDLATALKRNYSAVSTGYRQQNGPGDIAMINGLQKMIDEGVVREGDVALQLKGMGIEGGIAGAQAFLQSKGFFSPDIRNKIMATSNDLYTNLNATYKDRVGGYRGIVDRTYGEGAFRDVLPPETESTLGWNQQNAPSASQQPQGPQAPAGAKRGPDGNYYAADPNKPGSFPQVQQGPDGKWRMKSANGQLLEWSDE